jgi:hypothetical protein
MENPLVIDALFWFFCLLVAFLAFQHFVLPLAVYFFNVMPYRYVFMPLPWGEFLAAQTAPFTISHEQLLQLGFTPVGASSLNMSPSKTSFVLYRQNDGTATATLMCSTAVTTEYIVVDFTQTYEDGVNLSVCNGPTPLVFPSWHRRIFFRAHEIKDPQILYSRFQAITAKLARPGAIPLPPGQEFETVSAWLNDELHALASMRFTRPPKGDGKLRFTLWAAYVSSWKLIWPWKFILNRLDSRRVIAFAS